MKMKHPKKSKGFYITLWSLIALMLLAVGAYAATYVINQDGVFVGGNKSYARTADVVVCRGTSALDDIVKGFQCDVVCKSTDGDCGDDITQIINDNMTILIRNGIYPQTTSIMINHNNVKILGESWSAELKKTSEGQHTFVSVFPIQNLVIEGLTLNGNNISSSVGTTFSTYFSNIRNLKVLNNHIMSYSSDGLHLRENITNYIIENNLIENNYENAIFTYFNFNGKIINNFIYNSSHGHGLLARNVSKLDFSHNNLFNFPLYSIISIEYSNNSQFNSNILSGGGNSGITDAYGVDNQIDGNTLNTIYVKGIYSLGSLRSSINFNKIESMVTGNSIVVEANINSYLSNNIVSNSFPYLLVSGPDNYIDAYNYTSLSTCGIYTSVNGMTEFNSTNGCTCINGAWKCWGMT